MTHLDAIVVGGGVQGAAIALELVRHGLRPLVLEEHEPGAATTAASFGLVHGGLRYLQKLDLSRARRSRREQAWWATSFPGFVRRAHCVMPLYRGAARNAATFRAAFLLDRLACTHLPHAAGQVRAAASVCPGLPLERERLAGAACWDEMLLADTPGVVRAMLDSVTKAGGVVTSGVEVTAPILQRRRVAGVRAHRRADGARFEVDAAHVLLCAGARSRTVARSFGYDDRRLGCSVLAFNLLLDLPLALPDVVALSPRPGRGRALFLRAAENGIVAGTWYAPWRDGDAARVPEGLVLDALADVQRCLPGMPVTRDMLAGVMAGALPGVDESGCSLRTRDVVVDHGRASAIAGVYSVLGTKLTTARALAERVVRTVFADACPSESAPGAVLHAAAQEHGSAT